MFVYGIDSAFMDNYDENGYPLLDENSNIYPLTLLIDEKLLDNTIKLTVPTIDDDNETDQIIVNISKFEYA